MIKCLDEAGGEDREDHAGDQLQGKAVQPHVHSEDILVNNLIDKISILLRKPMSLALKGGIQLEPIISKSVTRYLLI